MVCVRLMLALYEVPLLLQCIDLGVYLGICT